MVVFFTPEYQGRTGIVIVDSAPGELVEVEFEDEVVPHSFNAKELELIED
jgi:hypothetical protein